MKKNDIVRLRIEDVSFEGAGVAKYDGEVVFVRNSVLGDECDCKILKAEKNYAFAAIEKIVTPSPSRIETHCPVFGKCGGCVFLNTDYKTELDYKRNLVVSAFRRFYGENIVIEATSPSPVTENYRNKAIYPLSLNGKFGFYAPMSHRVFENEDCELQNPKFVEIVRYTEKYIAENKIAPYDEKNGTGLFRYLYIRAMRTGESMVCAVINGDKLPDFRPPADSVYININRRRDNVLLGEKFIHISGKKKITETLNNIEFRVSPAAFFQINPYQTEKLYEYAVLLADIKPGEKVLDLCCGIGTIALTAAKMTGASVTGVEIVPEAIEDAKENAEINGLSDRTDFYCADESEIRSAPDVVFADPPRKGLSEETVRRLIALAPSRIVYVSCNPETLARDTAAFRAGGYAPSAVRPFDMFPRTKHVETVVLLCKK